MEDYLIIEKNFTKLVQFLRQKKPAISEFYLFDILKRNKPIYWIQ